MKSLLEFIELEKTPVKEQEFEIVTESEQMNLPPAVLIMKRKSIRQFPNGERVAMYHIEKIDKYVTIPIQGKEKQIQVVPEETQLEENIIHHLKKIVDDGAAKTYKFEDGKTMKIDRQTAHAVLKMHNALNDDNKQKVESMARKSKQHFGKVVDFAWKHVK